MQSWLAAMPAHARRAVFFMRSNAMPCRASTSASHCCRVLVKSAAFRGVVVARGFALLSSAKMPFTRKQPQASIHDAAHQGRMRPERHRILRDDVAKTAPGWPPWWPADREPRDPAARRTLLTAPTKVSSAGTRKRRSGWVFQPPQIANSRGVFRVASVPAV
jgi:hypothetical protein